MELITNIIVEYLKHNKRLVVPKLGAFIVKQPSGIVRFSELMRNDDGVLHSLLMAYGANSLEASGMIDRFVFEVRHAITIGEEHEIKNFGTFRAGENNTILFRHNHEPIKVGGNIKPPVEALVLAQQRLRRSGVRPVHHSTPASQPQRRNVVVASQSEISITKPDNYLRGLNYDKTKGRKHGDDSLSGGSRGRSRTARTSNRTLPILLVTLLLAGAVVGAWYLWQYFSEIATVDSTTQSVHIIEPREEHIVADSIAIDSLSMQADTLMTAKSNNIVTQ